MARRAASGAGQVIVGFGGRNGTWSVVGRAARARQGEAEGDGTGRGVVGQGVAGRVEKAGRGSTSRWHNVTCDGTSGVRRDEMVPRSTVVGGMATYAVFSLPWDGGGGPKAVLQAGGGAPLTSHFWEGGGRPVAVTRRGERGGDALNMATGVLVCPRLFQQAATKAHVVTVPIIVAVTV